VNITVDKVTALVPVTVLRLDGDLDASTYEGLIEVGRQVIDEGAHAMLVDMRKVPFMGSSGLVAFHTLALLLAGEEPPDLEGGWNAHHAMQRSVEDGMQELLQLLGPVASVRRALERTGMTRFIPVHDDEATALAAFH